MIALSLSRNRWLVAAAVLLSLWGCSDPLADENEALRKEIIEVHEWDMRTREGVDRFRELKAKSLPSVALDDDLVYESLIPMQEELTDEILRRYKEKNQNE